MIEHHYIVNLKITNKHKQMEKITKKKFKEDPFLSLALEESSEEVEEGRNLWLDLAISSARF